MTRVAIRDKIASSENATTKGPDMQNDVSEILAARESISAAILACDAVYAGAVEGGDFEFDHSPLRDLARALDDMASEVASPADWSDYLFATRELAS